ncbi:hypothetical protein D5F01_LYC24041 [Larimichthys crocea]|uniref:Uncharacterized protein n=1 Tax=Larimichthys crocea TaxID=215358 RepID=A0A6G0HFR9_LARCR|nr:hypothetical protein D5F01_LYC24041 [Larimichthys crocea]
MVNFFRENSEHMKPFLDKAADNPELRNIIRKLQRNDEAYYPEFVVEAIQRYYASEFYLVMEDILTDIVPDFSSEAICQSAEQYYKRCLDNIKVDPRLYKYVFEDLTSDEFKRAYREHRWISNSVVAFTLFKHDTFGSLITVVISTMLVPKAASA